MWSYWQKLSTGKTILWCYLIWYLVVVFFYFDPRPRIWLNSVGISIVIGIALILSVSPASGVKLERWQLMRLFAMPFCVSSFSALIKDKGFIFIIPPVLGQQLYAAGLCLAFIFAVLLIKQIAKYKKTG
ncbi:MAG: hypothetical protein H7A08_07010 [Oceanospirillaceae bacterium]|nr:hypothetical protein [Oceanospirillaceae bacterium]